MAGEQVGGGPGQVCGAVKLLRRGGFGQVDWWVAVVIGGCAEQDVKLVGPVNAVAADAGGDGGCGVGINSIPIDDDAAAGNGSDTSGQARVDPIAGGVHAEHVDGIDRRAVGDVMACSSRAWRASSSSSLRFM